MAAPSALARNLRTRTYGMPPTHKLIAACRPLPERSPLEQAHDALLIFRAWAIISS